MSAALVERWRASSARFAALQRREKWLVTGATVFAILFGGYSFWVEPAKLATARLKQTLVEQQSEQERLRAQLLALTAQLSDPDAANRAQLEELQQQLAAIEHDLQSFDHALVAPSEVTTLLQTLLTRHRGLSLVSLTTLPPKPLIPAPMGAGETSAKPATALPHGNFYRHGIEIRIAGAYLDLLAYVAELERGPPKLLWGGLQLAVERYPVCQLTLTVYTLSLESTWLVV